MGDSGFGELSDARFVSVTTFRKNGEEVSTPVWVVGANGSLYVRTDPTSGKVKRLRRDPRVLLAPCRFRGKETGPRVEGRARLLDASDRPDVVPALDKKYGLPSRMTTTMVRIRRKSPLILEIEPAAAAGSSGQESAAAQTASAG